MTFAIRTTLESVKSFVQANSPCDEVIIGQPSPVPGHSGCVAHIFMAGAGITFLTRDTTIQTHTVTIRIYRNILAEPAEDTEIQIADVVSTIITAALGNFDLTAEIENLDSFEVGVRWDVIEAGNVQFRTAEIDLPLNYREATE